MSFIRDYLFDLEKQEGALWSAPEYLGITGGAPLALALYWVIFALAVAKLPGWESVLLAVGGIVIALLVLLQRAAFPKRRERARAEEVEARGEEGGGSPFFDRVSAPSPRKIRYPIKAKKRTRVIVPRHTPWPSTDLRSRQKCQRRVVSSCGPCAASGSRAPYLSRGAAAP